MLPCCGLALQARQLVTSKQLPGPVMRLGAGVLRDVQRRLPVYRDDWVQGATLK